MTSLESLVLLPLTHAVSALRDRPMRLRVVVPPYRALGVGTLRCLRIAPPAVEGAPWEIAAGYDRYERA